MTGDIRRGTAGTQGTEAPIQLPGQTALGAGVPQVLSAASYGFNQPFQIAFDGTHLWITNGSGNSVTEINASDGSLV